MDSALRDSKLPRGLLSFEVTETAAVANIVRAEALIRRLRDLGSDVALDDFGRGLSSLTYLKTLPVTHLKIDGIFVRDVVADEPLAGDAERDRAARPGDEAEDRGGMRRKRRDLRGDPGAGGRLRAGFLHRAAAAAREGAGHAGWR